MIDLLVAAAFAVQTLPEADARRAMQAFGSCIAERSPAMSADTLAMDFTTTSYQSRLRQMSRANEDCFRMRGGRMGFGNLAIAGAIAERLVEGGTAPLNVRLARAAQRPGPATYSPSDRAAMCVARSVPDDVAALFATEVASADENSAARALEPALAACNRDGPRLSVTTAGVRAMLATAAFRSLNHAEPTLRSRN